MPTLWIPADTFLSLGKTESSIDGGQMIKPALARGYSSPALRLVGPTCHCSRDHTHKRRTERMSSEGLLAKDAALERRFQPVTIEEPTVESTISTLRGPKLRYEVCLRSPLGRSWLRIDDGNTMGLRFRWRPGHVFVFAY